MLLLSQSLSNISKAQYSLNSSLDLNISTFEEFIFNQIFDNSFDDKNNHFFTKNSSFHIKIISSAYLKYCILLSLQKFDIYKSKSCK